MGRRAIALGIAALVLCGCGDDDSSVANKAGSKVGETITEFASGVGKGIDTQMTVNVELAEPLTKQGISRTVAKQIGIEQPGTKGITIYLIAKNPFKGKLIAKASNKDGQEIGRSVVEADFQADDARYVTFTFEKELDTLLVSKYVVDIKN